MPAGAAEWAAGGDAFFLTGRGRRCAGSGCARAAPLDAPHPETPRAFVVRFMAAPQLEGGAPPSGDVSTCAVYSAPMAPRTSGRVLRGPSALLGSRSRSRRSTVTTRSPGRALRAAVCAERPRAGG